MVTKKNEKALNFVHFILLLFLFEPNVFVKHYLLNNLFIAGACISFFVVVCMTIEYKITINKVTFVLILWRFVTLLSTIINGRRYS